ncbi:MAG: hypothetical protein CMJ18_09270, partial [Phycisphaeraceae bacterium]|nr:hypothetical protein [Phycisphaeraceae bacterium]
ALLLLVLLLTLTAAAPARTPDVTELHLVGRIDGDNITFTLEGEITTTSRRQSVALLAGDVAVERFEGGTAPHRLRYDAATETYCVVWQKKGRHRFSLQLAARPGVMEDREWRQATFTVPASRIRHLEVHCDRADLEVQLPDAVKVKRAVEGDTMRITALQDGSRPFDIRWKPQVRKLDAKLVTRSETNTIVTAVAGALRVDSLFSFDVAQGTLTDLAIAVPGSLNVTQVRGAHIRDWRMEGADGDRRLVVTLNRPQTRAYALQVAAESHLSSFPVDVDLPVMSPEGGLRRGGQIVVGTDSAIELVVQQTSGLSQIDAAAFKRIVLGPEHPRALPAARAFFYTYAGGPFRMKLALDNITPSMDAVHRIAIALDEDDLAINAAIEIDVRDAPIRRLTLAAPKGYLVAAVKGKWVGDFAVHERAADDDRDVVIELTKPLLGRALFEVRYELGRGPLDQAQRIGHLHVRGTRNERGYVVIVPDAGVQIEAPQTESLRAVHTASVPVQLPGAEYAYRFRDGGWSLELTARRRPAGVRVESFHVVSISDAVVYGGVAVNYFITSAPVDELRFVIPRALGDVEFVGRDVLQTVRDENDPSRYTVKLSRKVTGDYNLGITYHARYEEGRPLALGGIECLDVQTQVGFITVASHLDLQIDTTKTHQLLEIARDEIPANYRLLVNAPILKTYKFVGPEHRLEIGIAPYERGKVLPSIIEVMDIHTNLAIPVRGTPEAVTRVRYLIKNATDQYLTVALPLGATVWRTRLIEQFDTSQPKPVPLITSFDEKTGRLMIPLRRGRDPNQPMAIEIEYGQVHSSREHLVLTAPKCHTQSTYESWSVAVPADWSIHEAASDDVATMTAQPRAGARPAPVRLMESITALWRDALARQVMSRPIHIGALAAVGVLIVILLAWRRVFVTAAVVAVLGLVAAFGAAAVFDTRFSERIRPPDLTHMTFTQQVNMDSEAPVSIAFAVAPTWRQDATRAAVIYAPAATAVLLVSALLFRRLRRVAIAGAICAVFYSASHFHQGVQVLAHALTWGLPSTAGLLLLARLLPAARFRRVPAAAAAPAAIALAFALAATATASTPAPAPGEVADEAASTRQLIAVPAPKMPDPVAPPSDPIIDAIHCTVTVEDDNVRVIMDIEVTAERPVSLDLERGEALLLTTDPPGRHVRIEDHEERYRLIIDRRGRHRVQLEWIAPLAEPDEQQMRTLTLHPPPAMRRTVDLNIPDTALVVKAPSAVRFESNEGKEQTTARALFRPHDDVTFTWKPRARQRQREDTVFLAHVISAAGFDRSLVEIRHHVQLQIAQGELSTLHIDIPDGLAVTALAGDALGTWRFDPTDRALEARLTRPVSGTYDLQVVTQMPIERLPAEIRLRPLWIEGALRQRATLGLVHGPAVHLQMVSHPQVMNSDDFMRIAEAPLAALPIRQERVPHAFRMLRREDKVEVRMTQVLPELRVSEQTGFTVSDDRLVYAGTLTVSAAKSGIFSFRIRIPKGYDVDALGHKAVSHWDEWTEGDRRIVEVHLKRRFLGDLPLKLALSSPVTELPRHLRLPRIELEGAAKTSGRVVITSARGVGLSVADRHGVSELDPHELGIKQDQVLAFKLLRPNWRVELRVEVIEPRIAVDFLHVAQIGEGFVRHAHHLRYQLENAGTRAFELQLPPDALGLLFSGEGIARREEIEPGSGRWRIELDAKWHERYYAMKIQYETRYDHAQGALSLGSVRALNVPIQRGHLVVRGSDRVELNPTDVSSALRPDSVHGIPEIFGAGDLSGAVFCYRSNSAEYALKIQRRRHESAPLLDADITSATISSVMTRHGQSLNRVELQMAVAGRRHLEARLPVGARLWSLLVNGRPVIPSRTTDDTGEGAFLFPLAQVGTGSLPVVVSFIYFAPAPAGWSTGDQSYEGPRFDLPLKNITWLCHVPNEFSYDRFDGSLAVNRKSLDELVVLRYDATSYASDVQRTNDYNAKQAKRMLDEGGRSAQRGDQRQAKLALESAWHYSMGDRGLNEDARVQLNQLVRQQAMVGLLGSRGRLRRQSGADDAPAPALGENFSTDQAERLTGALLAPDSENLQRICERVVGIQEAAAPASAQLVVNMPLRGRVLEFNRPIQVAAQAPMRIAFRAKRPVTAGSRSTFGWLGGLFAITLGVLTLAPRANALRRRVEDRLEREDDSHDGFEVIENEEA